MSEAVKRQRSQKSQVLKWSDHQIVSEVFHQEKWNICWVISGLKAIESVYMLRTKEKGVALSKQEIVDCFYSVYPIKNEAEERELKPNLYEGTCGFRPNSTSRLMKYVREQGVCAETDWKWHNDRGTLRPKPPGVPYYTISGYKYERRGLKECDLVELVKKHPVAAAMRLYELLQRLQRGVLYLGPTSGEDLVHKEIPLHAVLVVGFGIDEATKKRFMWIQNSYGKNWGDDGYGRVLPYLLTNICYPTMVQQVAPE